MSCFWQLVEIKLLPRADYGSSKVETIAGHSLWSLQQVNTLRPRPNGRHFIDDIFKWIFLEENVWISINISLKFVPRGPINNIPTLVQIMAWRQPGDKPLSEPMMVSLLTHICVTRPQWVNPSHAGFILETSRCISHHVTIQR